MELLKRGTRMLFFEYSNMALEAMGYKERIKLEDNFKLYGKKWYEYFEYLLPNISKNEWFAIHDKCWEIQEQNSDIVKKHIRANNNAIDVLHAIHESNNEQIVISNTRKESLKFFLDTVDMLKYFEPDRYLSTNAHLKSLIMNKPEVLDRYLVDKIFDSFVTIGDSANDINVIENVGGTSYLYSHMDREVGHCNPTYKINDLRKILKELS